MGTRHSAIWQTPRFWLVRFGVTMTLVSVGRPAPVFSDPIRDCQPVANTGGLERIRLRPTPSMIAADMTPDTDPEILTQRNNEENSRAETLVPAVTFMLAGAAYLAAGLTSQLAVNNGHTDRNFFRYVNYGAMETLLSVSGVGFLLTTFFVGGEIPFLLVSATLLAAAAVYGVYGWRLRDNEAMYYASMSTVSAALMVFGVQIVFH